MTQALVEKQETLMGVAEWGTIKEQASILIKTGFLPPSIKTAEQVIAIALTGRELGIGMMEAIRGINVIQSKPSVSPQLMLALAIRTGQVESYSMKIVNGSAEVMIKRKGWPEHRTSFGPIEAKALGLDAKDNYRKQALVMYKWRALSEALRFTFPDAVSGIYTFDEMGAEMTAEGDIETKPTYDNIPMPQEKKPEVVEAQVSEQPELPGTLSDEERKLLFKLAKIAYGAEYETKLRSYLNTAFNTEHTSKLEPNQYQQAIAWLKELAEAMAQ